MENFEKFKDLLVAVITEGVKEHVESIEDEEFEIDSTWVFNMKTFSNDIEKCDNISLLIRICERESEYEEFLKSAIMDFFKKD